MLKKIATIAAKTVAGIFLFYLFISWVAIPLAAPWAIKSQGTKILKTPVQARAVAFNPFLWQITLKGIEVLDAQKQVMAGFDKLQIDISFVALFKKLYRVESILLDGLKVSVVLLPDGSVNLLSLVPKETAAAPPPAQELEETNSPVAAPANTAQPQTISTAALPPVVIDDISLTNGQIHVTDQTLQPNFATMVNAINIRVTGLTTRPDCRMNVTFQAKLDDRGTISSETMLDPFVQPLRMETSFTLDQYAMQVLTPYTGKYTGRELADGSLMLKMDYKIADNKISAAHKLLIQKFTFGEKIESKDALNLPFGLAVALLEDPQGRINISLPVKGDMSDPEFEYMHILGQVARNFFIKLVTKPFSFLASVIGSESGTEEMGTVKFLPGKADITPEDMEKLAVLARGLNERPRLSLEINGTYDPDADWKMMKTEVFNKDFDQLKEESTKAESWVYQQLYQRQFGVRDLWKITKSFKSKDGTYDESGLNAAIKNAIIEFGEPDKSALEVLAQARAKMISDALLAAGFDPKRMTEGQVKTAQASMGFVPLEFTLTVFGDDAANGTAEAAEVTTDDAIPNSETGQAAK